MCSTEVVYPPWHVDQCRVDGGELTFFGRLSRHFILMSLFYTLHLLGHTCILFGFQVD